MNQKLLDHYLETSVYTYAGKYEDYFKSLPDNIPELAILIFSQIIHRITLKEGNTNANRSLQYGDMTRFPWYRMRCEDDILMTAAAMTAELFRLDNDTPRGKLEPTVRRGIFSVALFTGSVVRKEIYYTVWFNTKDHKVLCTSIRGSQLVDTAAGVLNQTLE